MLLTTLRTLRSSRMLFTVRAPALANLPHPVRMRSTAGLRFRTTKRILLLLRPRLRLRLLRALRMTLRCLRISIRRRMRVRRGSRLLLSLLSAIARAMRRSLQRGQVTVRRLGRLRRLLRGVR